MRAGWLTSDIVTLDDQANADDRADARDGAEAGDGADAGDLPVGIDWTAGEWDIGEFLVPTPPDRLSMEVILGRAFLRLRLYLGWSQRDLERASGVDQSTICRLEVGKGANVGSRRLVALLSALRADDVVFLPRPPAAPPTALELMLHGDPWERAIREADRRVNRRRSA
jgi:transcriptional regulator with XRE-family HTH domain